MVKLGISFFFPFFFNRMGNVLKLFFFGTTPLQETKQISSADDGEDEEEEEEETSPADREKPRLTPAPREKSERKDKKEKKKERSRSRRRRRSGERSRSAGPVRTRSLEAERRRREALQHRRLRERREEAVPEPLEPPRVSRLPETGRNKGGGKARKVKCDICGQVTADHASAIDQHKYLNEYILLDMASL